MTEEPFKTTWLVALGGDRRYGIVQETVGEASSGCHWQAELNSDDPIDVDDVDAETHGQLPV